MPTLTPIAVLLNIAEENRLSSDDFTRALSAAKVRTAKPGASPVKLADGGGLTAEGCGAYPLNRSGWSRYFRTL